MPNRAHGRPKVSLVGYDLSLDERRRQTLEMVVQDLFPGGATCRRPSSGQACAR